MPMGGVSLWGEEVVELQKESAALPGLSLPAVPIAGALPALTFFP